MSVESKIKEVSKKEQFPALYCSDERAQVILVSREINNKVLEGVVVHPSSSIGTYSMSWSKDKFKRMEAGSELTVKIIQE